MSHHELTKPLYSCNCSRFTGALSRKGNAYDLDLPKGTTERIKRTDYCKHILAVMRETKDPRYDEYVRQIPLPVLPLNHPNGMIQPAEGSTYSRNYKPGRGNPSKERKNPLWGKSGLKRPKMR